MEPDRDKRYDVILPPVKNEIPAYLAQSAIRTAKDLHPKAIVTTSITGRTARYISAYRSNVPIYAKCTSKRVVRELALSFGINPGLMEFKMSRLNIQKAAIRSLIKDKTITADDLIIYVGGSFGKNYGASYMEISTARQLSHTRAL